ncbi:MAG: hypothetical protein IPN92_10455 [Chromatiaceae bacterium]|nr:hypothetical protein [Chromatiaceae bacterium]
MNEDELDDSYSFGDDIDPDEVSPDEIEKMYQEYWYQEMWRDYENQLHADYPDWV